MSATQSYAIGFFSRLPCSFPDVRDYLFVACHILDHIRKTRHIEKNGVGDKSFFYPFAVFGKSRTKHENVFHSPFYGLGQVRFAPHENLVGKSFSQPVYRRRGQSIARKHEQIRVKPFQNCFHRLVGNFFQLSCRFISVRQIGVVGKIDEILLRQNLTQPTEHAQPSHSAIYQSNAFIRHSLVLRHQNFMINKKIFAKNNKILLKNPC